MFFLLIFGIGCHGKSNTISSETSEASFQSLHKTITAGSFKMAYKRFEGTENITINANKKNKFRIKYNSKIKDGILSIVINDPYGTTISTLPVNKKGTIKFSAKGNGRITILVTGRNTSGSFKISWKKY